MNLSFLFKGARRELTLVLATLSIMILMPLFAVIVVAQSGVVIVSETLAAINPVTHLVEIFNPEGVKVVELELSTAWPLSGPVTDEFGTYSELRRSLGLSSHTGIDISAPEYTPVRPFMIGTVLEVDNIDDSSCGKNILLDQGNRIMSRYCHLSYAVEYAQGDPVTFEDVIGYTGNTGVSTGSHLHFMIYVYGIPVNPRNFMAGNP